MYRVRRCTTVRVFPIALRSARPLSDIGRPTVAGGRGTPRAIAGRQSFGLPKHTISIRVPRYGSRRLSRRLAIRRAFAPFSTGMQGGCGRVSLCLATRLGTGRRQRRDRPGAVRRWPIPPRVHLSLAVCRTAPRSDRSTASSASAMGRVDVRRVSISPIVAASWSTSRSTSDWIHPKASISIIHGIGLRSSRPP